jgi:hypothetical protein
MDHPPVPPAKEQRLLRNARREGLLILAVWLTALVWTLTVSWFAGYARDPKDVPLVFGMPDWAFWGVVVPWLACLVFSAWFCFGFMTDDDLGRDQDSEDAHA